MDRRLRKGVEQGSQNTFTMKATNHGTGVTVEVNPEEYVTLLRPDSMLQICSAATAVKVIQRKVGGIIIISLDQIAIIFGTDPRHEIDLELKKLIAVQRVAVV